MGRAIQANLSRAENALLERLRQTQKTINREQLAVLVIVVTRDHVFWRVAGKLETVDEDTPGETPTL